MLIGFGCKEDVRRFEYKERSLGYEQAFHFQGSATPVDFLHLSRSKTLVPYLASASSKVVGISVIQYHSLSHWAVGTGQVETLIIQKPVGHICDRELKYCERTRKIDVATKYGF